MTWYEKAACAGMDVNVFFEDPSGHFKEAREVCRWCPVRQECLQEGMSTPYGIWGGANRRDRERIMGYGYNSSQRDPAKPRTSRSDEFDQKVVELYKSGMGFRRIARELDVSPTMIRTVTEDYGIKRPPDCPGLTPDERARVEAEIVELYQSGKSIMQIVETTEHTHSMVKRVIGRAGIGRNQAGGHRTARQNKIIKLWEAGETNYERIAVAAACSKHWVGQVILAEERRRAADNS